MLLATLFRGFSTKNPLITEATSKKKASNEHLNRLYEVFDIVKLLNEFYSQSTEKSYGLLGNLLGLKPWEANSLIRTIDNFFKLNNNTKNHSDITTNYIDSFESLANSEEIYQSSIDVFYHIGFIGIEKYQQRYQFFSFIRYWLFKYIMVSFISTSNGIS